MEGQKSFFELLSPKSAMLVGMVGGLLTLGTIGFVVLGFITMKQRVSQSTGGDTVAATQQNTPAATPQANNTPAAQIPKTDKPKVELFVMSYCPYGLQEEKAFAPAYSLLKNKADMSIKFVYYAMHGKKEVDENTRQYCIESEQNDKYVAYLNCFFGAGQNNGTEADYQKCLTSAGVNTGSLNSCVSKTDKQFGITAKFNDQSTWLSGQFPLYPIYDADNTKYRVQGSPTLVINGVTADVGRTPEAVKAAICSSFNNAPSECQQNLNNNTFQAGFGLSAAAGGGASSPGCGT